MGDVTNIAYLRELPADKQCDFTFTLKLELKQCTYEDIHVVCPLANTVQSLIEQITSTVCNIRKLRGADDPNETDLNVEFAMSFVSPRKKVNAPVKPTRSLQTLLFPGAENLRFSICNQHFKVIINAPLVKEIRLPCAIFVDFETEPKYFSTLYTDRKESKFQWYKSKDKVTWTPVGHKYKYKVKEDDLGYFLKLVCVPFDRNLVQGVAYETVSQSTVGRVSDIPVCPFEERHSETETKLEGKRFRLVSYNVLSSLYTDISDHFAYCPPSFLAVDYRKQLIVKELLGYNADIICLQELDLHCLTSYYKNIFKNHGYVCNYHKKGNRITEGLACIFNKSRFKKVDCHQLVYSESVRKDVHYKQVWNLIKTDADLKALFLRQPSSLQVTLLKEKNGNDFVLVANTHLFYHPDANHVRLLQVHMALVHLNLVIKGYKKLHKHTPSVILCGDFNSLPQSAVYNYITQGNTEAGDDVIKRFAGSNTRLSHPFKLESACGQPQYTNYTSDFKGCLDYIFIEHEKLEVVNVVKLPTEEQLACYEGLPNEVYPSDHLALVVDLSFV